MISSVHKNGERAESDREQAHTILSSGNPDLYKIDEKQFQTHLNQKYQQSTV